MLFNSVPFLLCFLPTAIVGYQLFGRYGRRSVVGWLGTISLVFYGIWRPGFVFLLIASILLNYCCSLLISKPDQSETARTTWLVTGISANLSALVYFKYLFPFVSFLHRTHVTGADWGSVVLPLGISFFTFTQIAYLVDLRQGEAERQDLVSYVLFVTFFPHLIAGPILHHREIMPQFSQKRRYRLDRDDVRIGLSWFLLGMGKKILIADRLSSSADTAFAGPHGLSLLASWVGVLDYSLQLYFDFSGYSDMAIGLARMFSIRFPLNFNSPYKATSIVDFWQRWHMTLTRYLTLYLYNPIALSVSRRRLAAGKKVSAKAARTVVGFGSMVVLPTMVTMFLAGVWHGAGMQFLIFGLLHGAYISINHAWRTFVRAPVKTPSGGYLGAYNAFSVLTTYLCVVVGQVFFRAHSLHDALEMLRSMEGCNGLGHIPVGQQSLLLVLLFPVVWFMPNTQEIMGQAESKATSRAWLPGWLIWKPSLTWSLSLGALSFLVLMYLFNSSSFLYFQF